MTFDYEAAGEWRDVVTALVLTENGGVEPATANIVGDGGQAIGILQQHPAFFQEYYGRVSTYPAEVGDDWPTAQIKAAAAFLETWHTIGRDLLVQAYNQGIHGVLRKDNPVRAPKYLADFGQNMGKIHGHWPSYV